MFDITDCMSEHWKTNLRQVMDEKGVYMNDLSKRLGHNDGYITQMLNKPHTPGIKTLGKIAKELGVPLARIVDGDPMLEGKAAKEEVFEFAKAEPEGKIRNTEVFEEAYALALEILSDAKGSPDEKIDLPELSAMVKSIYKIKMAKLKGD